MSNVKLSFGNKDFLYLTEQEILCIQTLMEAFAELRQKGYKQVSMTRLLKKGFEIRPSDYISENRLRRVLWLLISSRPKFVHIRQRQRYRLVFPTSYALEYFKVFKTEIRAKSTT